MGGIGPVEDRSSGQRAACRGALGGRRVTGRHANVSGRQVPQREAQAAGIRKLLELARPVTRVRPEESAGARKPASWERHLLDGPAADCGRMRACTPTAMAGREIIAPGALRDTYDIPEVTFD